MRTWSPTVLAVALAACGRESPPPQRQAAPAAPSAAHVATMAKLDHLAASSDPVSAESMKTLGGRLEYEATHRPVATPRAEDVLDALARAGVALAEEKQYIAMTVKAAYCVGGQTADGLSVAVCEYPSAAAAAAGKDFVTTRFRIPDLERVIHVRGATTLALGHAAGVPLDDLTRRAGQAFATL